MDHPELSHQEVDGMDSGFLNAQQSGGAVQKPWLRISRLQTGATFVPASTSNKMTSELKFMSEPIARQLILGRQEEGVGNSAWPTMYPSISVLLLIALISAATSG